jgi:PTH1 family peptidyl-tRNA hydrolase
MVTLVEPQLYMNRSGDALKQLGVSIEGQDLIVVHDELDLPRGRVRVKVGGSSAGHRGIESIAEHYGADFVRVRVGVGRPAPGTDVVDHVLSRFDDSEREEIAVSITTAASAVECVLERGAEVAMQRYNIRKPEADEPSASTLESEKERSIT